MILKETIQIAKELGIKCLKQKKIISRTRSPFSNFVGISNSGNVLYIPHDDEWQTAQEIVHEIMHIVTYKIALKEDYHKVKKNYKTIQEFLNVGDLEYDYCVEENTLGFEFAVVKEICKRNNLDYYKTLYRINRNNNYVVNIKINGSIQSDIDRVPLDRYDELHASFLPLSEKVGITLNGEINWKKIL